MFMIYRLTVTAGNAPDLLGAMIVIGRDGVIAIRAICEYRRSYQLRSPTRALRCRLSVMEARPSLFLMLEMGLVLKRTEPD
ncbi:MAG: hypothetical protein ACLT76_01295 [Clostridium fessum]